MIATHDDVTTDSGITDRDREVSAVMTRMKTLLATGELMSKLAEAMEMCGRPVDWRTVAAALSKIDDETSVLQARLADLVHDGASHPGGPSPL